MAFRIGTKIKFPPKVEILDNKMLVSNSVCGIIMHVAKTVVDDVALEKAMLPP